MVSTFSISSSTWALIMLMGNGGGDGGVQKKTMARRWNNFWVLNLLERISSYLRTFMRQIYFAKQFN